MSKQDPNTANTQESHEDTATEASKETLDTIATEPKPSLAQRTKDRATKFAKDHATGLTAASAAAASVTLYANQAMLQARTMAAINLFRLYVTTPVARGLAQAATGTRNTLNAHPRVAGAAGFLTVAGISAFLVNRAYPDNRVITAVKGAAENLTARLPQRPTIGWGKQAKEQTASEELETVKRATKALEEQQKSFQTQLEALLAQQKVLEEKVADEAAKHAQEEEKRLSRETHHVSDAEFKAVRDEEANSQPPAEGVLSRVATLFGGSSASVNTVKKDPAPQPAAATPGNSR